MASNTYPLALPDELYQELHQAAELSGVSMADVMRQTMKTGLPAFVAQFQGGNLKPFTAAERKLAFAPDEFDSLAKAHAQRARKPPEAD